MERPLLRYNRPLCRACQTSYRSQAPPVAIASLRFSTPQIQTRPKSSAPPWSRPSPVVHREIKKRAPFQQEQTDTFPEAFNQPQRQTTSGTAPSRAELEKAQELTDIVLDHPGVPHERQTLAALRAIEQLSAKCAGIQASPTSTSFPKKAAGTDSSTPISALLSLDPRTNTPAADPQKSGVSPETIDHLSTLAYDLVTHPPVFISPAILTIYTTIQSLLVRPNSFPEIFELYATKPVPDPQPRSSETKPSKPSATSTAPPVQITYHKQSPTALSSAIPTSLITIALNTATRTRSLPLALSIIEASLSTPSFRRNKLFRRALPPCTLASFAPLAAYSIATNLSHYQTALPAESFTAIAFAGLLTYATAVGTIGYVALTTSNDQMERVTWATGMPLWERWVREEERAAVDRVVLNWGFRERWRWGEEEGVEWEGLKDWAGLRGMVVDRVGLMEGME